MVSESHRCPLAVSFGVRGSAPVEHILTTRYFATRDRRQRRVDSEGSPNFIHAFGAIAATTGREHVDINVVIPAARRYEPMTSVRLTNQSGAGVDVFINGIDFVFLPAGVITTITDEAMWTLELRNLSATAVADREIRANFSRPPLGADEAARRAAAR